MEQSPGLSEGRLYHAYERFLDILSKGQGITPLLEAGYDMLGMPLHLLDPAFRLIRKVGGEGLDDERWLEYIEEGVISEKQLVRIKESGYLQRVQNPEGIPTIEAGCGGRPDVIGCDVVAKGKLIGRLGIWCTRSYTREDIDIVALLGKSLSAELQKYHLPYLDLHSRGDYFLSRILREEVGTKEEIEHLQNILDVKVEGRLRILLVRETRENKNECCAPSFIQRKVQAIFPRSLCTVVDDQVVALLNGNAGKSLSPEKRKELAALAERNKFRCGISREYDLLSKTAEHLRQAKAALRFAPADRLLSCYEDIFLTDILFLCSQSVNPEDLCYPPLLRLREYDASYHTEYVSSLRLFINHSGNMSRAAKALSIHYNTMKYRIDVIKELLEIENFSLPELAKLQFSLMAMEWH